MVLSHFVSYVSTLKKILTSLNSEVLGQLPLINRIFFVWVRRPMVPFGIDDFSELMKSGKSLNPHNDPVWRGC